MAGAWLVLSAHSESGASAAVESGLRLLMTVGLGMSLTLSLQRAQSAICAAAAGWLLGPHFQDLRRSFGDLGYHEVFI